MRFLSPQNRIVVVALSLFVTVIATAPTVSGDEYQPQTPVGRMMKGLNPANWKMPKLKTFLPGQEDKDRIIKRKDGLVTDVKQTASRSWAKTKETLNPMRLIPGGLFAADTKQTPQSTEPVQKAGFFGSLMGNAQTDVEQTSGSVNDFLNQNRPMR